MQVCKLVHHICCGLPWETCALIQISVLSYERQYYDILLQRFLRARFTLSGTAKCCTLRYFYPV
jgi:hypothetical protein